jgi:hypothetical protein
VVLPGRETPRAARAVCRRAWASTRSRASRPARAASRSPVLLERGRVVREHRRAARTVRAVRTDPTAGHRTAGRIMTRMPRPDRPPTAPGDSRAGPAVRPEAASRRAAFRVAAGQAPGPDRASPRAAALLAACAGRCQARGRNQSRRLRPSGSTCPHRPWHTRQFEPGGCPGWCGRAGSSGRKRRTEVAFFASLVSRIFLSFGSTRTSLLASLGFLHFLFSAALPVFPRWAYFPRVQVSLDSDL